MPIAMMSTGNRRALHADREARDDVGGVPGLRRPGDGADRPELRAGEELGDRDDEHGDDDADHRAPEKVEDRVRDRPLVEALEISAVVEQHGDQQEPARDTTADTIKPR